MDPARRPATGSDEHDFRRWARHALDALAAGTAPVPMSPYALARTRDRHRADALAQLLLADAARAVRLVPDGPDALTGLHQQVRTRVHGALAWPHDPSVQGPRRDPTAAPAGTATDLAAGVLELVAAYLAVPLPSRAVAAPRRRAPWN